jgi:hypothetical protein
MEFMARVGVGFCVSSVALCIFGGGVQAAFQILALSIVCTAGLGLVFWIPLWWFVGWVTMTLVVAVAESRATQPAKDVKPVVRRTEGAIMMYIRKATAEGMNQDLIVQCLQSQGWSLAEIQKARQSVESPSPTA